jgi:hypothetical protein
MSAGCSIRLSTPPRLSASANRSAALEEATRAVEVGVELDGQHAAEARRLPQRQLVLRVARQAGIEHPPHLRVGLEHARYLEGVVAVALHAHRQRLEPAQREEAVEGTGDAAHRVLQEAEPLAQGGVVAHHRHAADHVGVTVQVLGGGVHHDIEAVVERALHPRAREGVVGPGEHAAAARERRDGREIRELERRVSRALHPQQPRLGRIARSTAARSVKSTRVAVSPIERCRTRSSSRTVPPYRSSVVTMCAPASRHSSTVAIAARPEANAKACVPFSRSATQRSNAKRVGLWLRP